VLQKSGETIQAPLVILECPPRATCNRSRSSSTPDFARAVGNIKARGVVARGTLALEQPPAYSTFCIAPSLDYLERRMTTPNTARIGGPYVEVQRTDGRVEVHVQFVPPGNHDGLAERVAQI